MDKITKIELCLDSWTAHYPCGIIFWSFGRQIFSEYADSLEEYKHWIDEYADRFAIHVDVTAEIDPADIDVSNVVDVAKEIDVYIRDIIRKRREDAASKHTAAEKNDRGFDMDSFSDYIRDTFAVDYSCGFFREMLENIIEYGCKFEHDEKDQLCTYITDMIPEVEFGEVAQFCDDWILSEEGIKAKQKWISEHQ